MRYRISARHNDTKHKRRQLQNLSSSLGRDRINEILCGIINDDEIYKGGITHYDKIMQQMYGLSAKQAGRIEISIYRIIRQLAAYLPDPNKSLTS